jgi:hypothetical protein
MILVARTDSRVLLQGMRIDMACGGRSTSSNLYKQRRVFEARDKKQETRSKRHEAGLCTPNLIQNTEYGMIKWGTGRCGVFLYLRMTRPACVCLASHYKLPAMFQKPLSA